MLLSTRGLMATNHCDLCNRDNIPCHKQAGRNQLSVCTACETRKPKAKKRKASPKLNGSLQRGHCELCGRDNVFITRLYGRSAPTSCYYGCLPQQPKQPSRWGFKPPSLR